MNTLVLAVFASLAVFCTAAPSGHGTFISGPAGIVTPHGAIGPLGGGLGYGFGGHLGGHGGGSLIAGPVASPAVVAGPVAPHAAVVGPVAAHAAVVGPVAAPAAVIGPVAAPALVAGPGAGYGGHGGFGGFGLGYAGYGGFGHGLIGAGVGTAVGHHGVAVKGPATVPAVISGPAGKIVADGLYGVPAGHGYHGW